MVVNVMKDILKISNNIKSKSVYLVQPITNTAKNVILIDALAAKKICQFYKLVMNLLAYVRYLS